MYDCRVQAGEAIVTTFKANTLQICALFVEMEKCLWPFEQCNCFISAANSVCLERRLQCSSNSICVVLMRTYGRYCRPMFLAPLAQLSAVFDCAFARRRGNMHERSAMGLITSPICRLCLLISLCIVRVACAIGEEQGTLLNNELSRVVFRRLSKSNYERLSMTRN